MPAHSQPEIYTGKPLRVNASEYDEELAEEAAEEEAKLNEDCREHGYGTAECPRPTHPHAKPCPPRESFENMDSWFNDLGAEHARRKAEEADCRFLCEGGERQWCGSYKWERDKKPPWGSGATCRLFPRHCETRMHQQPRPRKAGRLLATLTSSRTGTVSID